MSALPPKAAIAEVIGISAKSRLCGAAKTAATRSPPLRSRVRIAFDLRRAFLEPMQTPWIEAATAELTDENDYWLRCFDARNRVCNRFRRRQRLHQRCSGRRCFRIADHLVTTTRVPMPTRL